MFAKGDERQNICSARVFRLLGATAEAAYKKPED
jgi:hypothetical protein